MVCGEHRWISGETIFADLNETSRDKSATCLNFVDIYFSDPLAKRMKSTLRGRKFDRITIMTCRGRLDLALHAIFDCIDVEYLKLDSLQIKKGAADAIAEGVAKGTTLKSLSFQALCMTEAIAESLQLGLRRTTSLVTLQLSAITSRLSDRRWVDIMLEAFRSNRTLKNLGIARVRGMEPDDIFRAIEGHVSLRSISIACLDGLSSSTMAALHGIAKYPNNELDTVKLSIRGDWTGLMNLPSYSHPTRALKFRITLSTSNQYQDMHLLGRILQENDAIEYLSLAHCGLDESKLVELAMCLGQVRGLKHLNLHGNCFAPRPVCRALLSALTQNRFLERIDLPVIVEEKATINHYLDCNRAGYRIMSDVALPASLWPIILQRAGTLDYTRTYDRIFKNSSEISLRQANAIFSLLQGPATFC